MGRPVSFAGHTSAEGEVAGKRTTAFTFTAPGLDFGRGVLVDLIGIEPMTSSMPWKRAPSCATGPLKGDLLIVAADERQVKPRGNIGQTAGV